ncbi:MetQ/NlpA family ABC transporter substrate-binding protein [Campylobacter sp. 19-13652]|uniref:MetQ/NlpA family ABC transporter substrate-binding protein n=1 Tax=Campylobacter sp. 19-13652 TaxID=2840180 RepID=UPI001C7783DE|nr:MetQ/NlpA family ABC transporter substrate-binding protein [Campylobacter sp. 19-13652]BCX79621.1 methionine ABC transporter substrate-binding protein [Campylobacter sp. 19-13652]
MKLTHIALAGLLAISANALEKLKVGATPVPHAEILELIKPDLTEAGYELEIFVFNDGILPNKKTDEGELDANYFQHLQYLNEFNKQKGTHLVPTVGVHLEPMGLYSKKIKSVSEFKKGDKITIPNDPTNETRSLLLLQKAGLIKLNDNPLAKIQDIVENPLSLQILELEPAQLPRTLRDTTASVINTNHALNAKLNPENDTIYMEKVENNPYVNYVVVRDGSQDKPKIKALDKAITSEKVKNFIKQKYQNVVIPNF